MSLLGDLALSFVLESITLIALWGGLAVAAAMVFARATGSPVTGHRYLRVPVLSGFAGAMVAASLSQRLGAGDPLMLAIGRRQVPVLWSLGGAIAGALIATLLQRRTRTA